jgi:predicted phage terminase large subunit-like protein
VLADAEHEWLVNAARGKMEYVTALCPEWQLWTTKQIAERGQHRRRIQTPVYRSRPIGDGVEFLRGETVERYIIPVPFGEADTVCITVDSPSHMFLCGKAYLPTHNSDQISRHFPAWYLGLYPDRSIIHTCYGWDLVRGFSRSNQDDIQSPAYQSFFPGVRLDPRLRGLYRWGLSEYSGKYVATGMGGAIVGHGANLLIIDDPVKRRKDVESRTFRDDQWDWYNSSARTRVEPNGAVIMTLTRWHMDDLAGRLLKASRDGTGEKWKVISLPEIAEEHDILGRKPGQVLWPERWSLEHSLQERETYPEYEWESQYQQHPTPPGGAIFKREWWKTYDHNHPIHLVSLVSSWDTSFKDGEENDYTAVWTAGLGTDGYIYVLDVAKIKVTSAELIGTESHPGMIQRYAAWLRGMGLRITALPIEDKGSGTTAIQMLALTAPDLPIIPVPVKGNAGKKERARAVTNFYRDGRILHRDNADWLDWYFACCEDFPGGEYDDPVDAMSQGLVYVAMPPQRYIEVYDDPSARVSLGRY